MCRWSVVSRLESFVCAPRIDFPLSDFYYCSGIFHCRSFSTAGDLKFTPSWLLHAQPWSPGPRWFISRAGVLVFVSLGEYLSPRTGPAS
jgi:hypothetical protein